MMENNNMYVPSAETTTMKATSFVLQEVFVKVFDVQNKKFVTHLMHPLRLH